MRVRLFSHWKQLWGHCSAGYLQLRKAHILMSVLQQEFGDNTVNTSVPCLALMTHLCYDAQLPAFWAAGRQHYTFSALLLVSQDATLSLCAKDQVSTRGAPDIGKVHPTSRYFTNVGMPPNYFCWVYTWIPNMWKVLPLSLIRFSLRIWEGIVLKLKFSSGKFLLTSTHKSTGWTGKAPCSIKVFPVQKYIWSFPHLGGDPDTTGMKLHSLQVLTLQLQGVQINSDVNNTLSSA